MGNADYSGDYGHVGFSNRPRLTITYFHHDGGPVQLPKEITEVVNPNKFNFLGGAVKGAEIVKFFCFPNVFGKEMFLSEALKKGYIQRERESEYRTKADIKYFKVFYKQESNQFGVESLYQSFFFELDSKAEYEHTIRPPLLAVQHWNFTARGKFMEDGAIKRHFSNTGMEEPAKKSSYFFYQRQMPLSLEILRQMVSRTPISASGLPLDPNEHFRVIR